MNAIQDVNLGQQWVNWYLPNICIIYMYLCLPYKNGSRNLCSTSCVLPSFDRANEVWGKVMFLHLAISHYVHRWYLSLDPGGVYHPPGHLNGQTHTQPEYLPDTHPPPLEAPPPITGGPWSGRYASYWNTFLFYIFCVKLKRACVHFSGKHS